MNHGRLSVPDTDDRYYQERHRQYDGELEKGLLHAPPRAVAGLGTAKEAAPRLPHLEKDYQDHCCGYQNLNSVQYAFQ